MSGQVLQRDTTVIVATDYAIQVPAVVPAGAHTFLMVNRGKEPHMVGISKVDAKHTPKELMEAMLKEQPAPWASDFGGPNLAAAGDTSNATMVLEPGRYLMICYFEAPDGKIHFMKGMFAEFEVKPVRVQRKAPRTDVTIVLSDFKLELSAPLRRGFNSIRVENRGPSDHDVQIVRLSRGSSMSQVMEWIENPGNVPAPGHPEGGYVGFDKKRSGYFTANLTRGDYVIFCWVPDKNGKPHFRHGMFRKFSIR